MENQHIEEAILIEETQQQEQQLQHEATGLMRLTDTNSIHRQHLADYILNMLENGEANPLEVHLSLKALLDVADRVMSNKRYEAAVLQEAQKYGKTFELHNAKLEIKEAGTKWDYSQTNDSKLVELTNRFDALMAQRKQREKFLQTIPEGGVADPETGELVYKAAKSSKTIVSVTLK